MNLKKIMLESCFICKIFKTFPFDLLLCYYLKLNNISIIWKDNDVLWLDNFKFLDYMQSCDVTQIYFCVHAFNIEEEIFWKIKN
jgi:hypothetical protein